jgi:hypothetical protein
MRRRPFNGIPVPDTLGLPRRFDLAEQVRVLGADSLLLPERPKRKNTQVERALQQEVMIRLRAYPVIAIPVPNSFFIPARTAAERAVARRLVSQMKKNGVLLTGAVDLVVLGRGASCCIELKRPAERTLLQRTPAGRLSDDQKEFRDRCFAAGVNWARCESWAEVEAALKDRGVIA